VHSTNELREGDKTLDLSTEGFLLEAERWNPSVAEALARLDGLAELTGRHWALVDFVRGYYDEFGVAPIVRRLCSSTGVTLHELYELFPRGPAAGVCRIAGLPNATGCL